MKIAIFGSIILIEIWICYLFANIDQKIKLIPSKCPYVVKSCIWATGDKEHTMICGDGDFAKAHFVDVYMKNRKYPYVQASEEYGERFCYKEWEAK
jgi:hypothetical protein